MKTKAESEELRIKEKEHILSLRGEAPSPVIARSLATKQSQDSLGTGSTISNDIPCRVYSEQDSSGTLFPQNDKQMARNDKLQVLSNQRGIALAIILVLSAIALAVMAGLIYMITSGTQVSGLQKRYKTALEAGFGGAEFTYQFVALRGDTTDTTSFISDLTNASIPSTITTPAGCTGTDLSGVSYTGWAAKLNTPTTSWSSACDSTMSISPGTATSYDMSYDLGSSPYPTYRIFAKIVDTVEGNSAPTTGLGGEGVVSSSSSEVTVMSMPYLYTIEMDAENKDNPSERAKLSILYEY
jgi:hypothetical protein